MDRKPSTEDRMWGWGMAMLAAVDLILGGVDLTSKGQVLGDLLVALGAAGVTWLARAGW
ncbi:MAG: hypothetical protein K6U14_10585 [Firmicutes bacterium]|nr:hypothetical protein [Alicyclobacillaceae bacterium]MCL6498057.1 hypothetical protein [Bacillota bacterium]